MDYAIVRSKIVGKNEHPLNGPNKEFGSTNDDCLPEVLARRCSSIKKLEVRDFCRQPVFLQQISGLKKMIPKQIMSLEEKYLRHCLELIHLSAMRENSWPVSTKVNLFPDRFSSRAVDGEALFLFSSVDENIAISSCVEDPIVGSITGSTSMKNILKSPLLLRQLGPSEDDDGDDNIKHGNPSAIQVRKSLCVGSSHSQDIQKKRVVPEDQIFRCEPLHKRLVSFSSTNSTYSDPSSSSSSSSSTSSFSSAYCHGMLHCSWNNGFPCYVFSAEDQREVYTTNLSKVDSEYVYMYYRGGKRENEADDEDLDVLGKMRVSTSFAVCNLGTEIMETEFILCATDSEGVLQHTSDHRVKKSRGLSKKVANMFPLSRQRRTKSKFDGSAGLQDNLLELEPKEQGNLFPESSSFPSNLELAAIVVKQHIPHTQNTHHVGGWGLKFLEQGGDKHKIAAPQLCRHHHSTSMDVDVVIPAGLHGGPTMKSGGPSSLVERWRSGGSCDCGGWDIGCPLTLLNALPNNKNVVYPAGVFGNTNSFQLFKQGSKQNLPVIEVTNVHDGLYYIHYQSTVSSLQSLSIAVAIIHSHSPTLKPKSI